MGRVLDASPEASFPELRPAEGHGPLVSKEGGKKVPTASPPAVTET